MLRGLLLIFVFAAVGEGLASWLSLPVPGSVVGMLLLAAALRLGLPGAQGARPAGEGLLRHMGVLFVPPGVGLLSRLGEAREAAVAIVVSSVVSFALVLVATGLVASKRAS